MQTTTAHKALQVAAAAAIAYPRPSAPRKPRAPKRAKEDRGLVAVVSNFGYGPNVDFHGNLKPGDPRWAGLTGGLRTALRLAQVRNFDATEYGFAFWCYVGGKWVPA